MKIKDLIQTSNTYERKLNKPYIIAEIGVNYECDMELAKRLIKEAKEGGANAVKFQTYKADTITSKNSPAYWDTSKEPIASQHELFSKHEGFWEVEMRELYKYCKSIDIEFMSTPFDKESAIFLNEIMEVFKISSSDITNKPFIEFICEFKKPIVLSTGASNLSEIVEAVNWIDNKGNDLALLHCILNYPTSDKNANLGMIIDLKTRFPDKIIGYSDHTIPNDMKVCEIATLLGSVIIEKHFTHDKSLKGNDHYHSMDKSDLILFRNNLDRIFEILGSFKVDAIKEESTSRNEARRSLVASKDIVKGSKIQLSDLTYKRPAHGISPKHIDKVIGKTATQNIKYDDLIQWKMIK
jgi:sialic acid synthase SpsE